MTLRAAMALASIAAAYSMGILVLSWTRGLKSQEGSFPGEPPKPVKCVSYVTPLNPILIGLSLAGVGLVWWRKRWAVLGVGALLLAIGVIQGLAFGFWLLPVGLFTVVAGILVKGANDRLPRP